MNNKSNYRLVARIVGNRLMINAEVRDEMALLYDRRMRRIEREVHDPNRRAYLLSVEAERKGDFLLATGAPAAALRAYIEAGECSLDGEYYDWERTQYPAHALYLRSRDLVRKAKQCAALDPRLGELLRGDRTFRRLSDNSDWEEYR